MSSHALTSTSRALVRFLVEPGVRVVEADRGRARLLAWLRLHASGKPPSVLLRRSWTLIADELGLTREAVYRALASLEREGRIERSDNTVRLNTNQT